MKFIGINQKEYAVYYTMYNGEDVLVGHINNIGNLYVFIDILFENIKQINSTSSLECMKNMISKYYSIKDTIGKIEEKYPYLF